VKYTNNLARIRSETALSLVFGTVLEANRMSQHLFIVFKLTLRYNKIAKTVWSLDLCPATARQRLTRSALTSSGQNVGQAADLCLIMIYELRHSDFDLAKKG
jgi:hypothetical protein